MQRCQHFQTAIALTPGAWWLALGSQRFRFSFYIFILYSRSRDKTSGLSNRPQTLTDFSKFY